MNYLNKKNARARRAGQRPHRYGKWPPSTFLNGQIQAFQDHHRSRCGKARFVFGWLRHFRYFLYYPNAPPTTTRRRRPEKNIPPRTRPRRVLVLARRRSEWAVGMAGPWCSSWVVSRSCRVSRREAQGQILTEATQRRDGLCVGIYDAPRGTGSILNGSMIVLSTPRRLRAPARAYSMTHPNK